MTEFLTWEYIATNVGAAFVVTLIVQFIKGFALPVKPNIMRLVAYGVSVVVLNLGAFFTGVWSVDTIGLSLLNAILLTLSAMAEYELAKTAGFYKSTETLVAMKAMSRNK